MIGPSTGGEKPGSGSLLPTLAHHSRTRSAASASGTGLALSALRRRTIWTCLVCSATLVLFFISISSRSNLSSSTTTRRQSSSAGPSSWLSSLKHGSGRSGWESPTRPLPLGATLEQRLESWSRSPIPEPSKWVRFNLETCGRQHFDKNANNELLKNAHLLWASMGSGHFRAKRQELIAFLRRARSDGRLSSKRFGTGRGLVFTAGNADTFDRVLVALKMLRGHLKVDLPAEIFSFPGEEPSDETRGELAKVNATLHTVEGAERDSHRKKNFHIKASALVQCSFREPLYLDSDNLPAALAPGQFERLWDSKGYRKLGAFFWPDYWKTSADNPIWLLIGTQCRDEWEQEAGQILVDKSRHLDALLLSEHMLQDWRYWFNMSDGDKDVFRFAMLALRKRWALPGRFLGAAGLSWNTATGYCGHTMLQHDAAGRPWTVHANLLKNIPSGLNQGTTFKRTRSFRLPAGSPPSSGAPSDDDDPAQLPDFGVEADQLANARVDGTAIAPAGEEVRRRAALELGLRPFLHGGSTSALCADIAWEDPRTEEDLEADEKRWRAKQAPASVPVGGSTEAGPGPERGEGGPDLSYTEAADGMRIVWQDPVETINWTDDPRLEPFEDRFFGAGGTASGKGF